MIKILLTLLLIPMVACAEFDGKKFGEIRAQAFRDEISTGQMDALAYRGDQALDRAVHRALAKLVANGKVAYATQKQAEWENQYQGTLSRSRMKQGIDDRRALWVWLSDFYNVVQMVLGVAKCKATHLSDIKTLNDTIRVVFNPCTFDLLGAPNRSAEYQNNMCKDSTGDMLYGFASVVTYWVVDGACAVATSVMANLLCPPISNLILGAEKCPALSKW
jgi:hypothetical protein